MSDLDRDETDEALRALPALDLPPGRAEALRARAHGVLAEARHRPGGSRPAPAWRRRAEALACGVVALVQLLWMVDAVLVPYR